MLKTRDFIFCLWLFPSVALLELCHYHGLDRSSWTWFVAEQTALSAQGLNRGFSCRNLEAVRDIGDHLGVPVLILYGLVYSLSTGSDAVYQRFVYFSKPPSMGQPQSNGFTLSIPFCH